jgi:hypothetical protein
LFDLETAIDKDWYADLMESVKLLSASDQEVARKIFYADFDLKNLLNLIRFGWYHELEKDRLASTLFPWGSLYGSKEVAAYLAAPKDNRDPMPIVKRFYPNLVPEIQDIIGKNRMESIPSSSWRRRRCVLSSICRRNAEMPITAFFRRIHSPLGSRCRTFSCTAALIR